MADKPVQTIAAARRQANKLIADAKVVDAGERQCKAIKKTGVRCKRAAIRGGRVCPTHGGSAPQVKAKAARRLQAMLEPSIIRMEALMHQDVHMPTALQACLAVQNRVLGGVGKEADTDTRPIIQIGIAVGGIVPQVTVAQLPPPSVDAEVEDE